MAISASFLKWRGLPSRRSTSIAASVKVMNVPGSGGRKRAGGHAARRPAPSGHLRARSAALSTLKARDSAMMLRVPMIRIRTGASWKHDPAARRRSLRRARRRRGPPPRAPWWTRSPSRWTASTSPPAGRRVRSSPRSRRSCGRSRGSSAGAPHATVPFRDGELELLIRRRGASALLTVVDARPPVPRARAATWRWRSTRSPPPRSRPPPRFCRELARLAARRRRRARRGGSAPPRATLRRAEPARPARRPPTPAAGAPAPAAPRGPRRLRRRARTTRRGTSSRTRAAGPTSGRCSSPGGSSLRGRGRARVAAFAGHAVPRAARPRRARVDGIARGGPRAASRAVEIAARAPGRGGRVTTLALDLAAGRLRRRRAPSPARRSSSRARSRRRARRARRGSRAARNPRQAENAHLAELEAAAAERLAAVEELAAGDRAPPAAAGGARARAAARCRSGRSAPGGCAGSPSGGSSSRRRRARRRAASPVAGGLVLAAARSRDGRRGRARARARSLWRAPGATFAAARPGRAPRRARRATLEALAPRTGRRAVGRARSRAARPPRRSRSRAARSSLAGARRAHRGSTRARAGRSGASSRPGAARLPRRRSAASSPPASDTGLVYGLDAAGRVVWRVRAPGAACCAPPAPALGLALVLCAADRRRGGARRSIPRPRRAPLRGAARLRPGERRRVAWGRRLAVAGTVAGDAARRRALERDGAPRLDGRAAARRRAAPSPPPARCSSRATPRARSSRSAATARRAGAARRRRARRRPARLPPAVARGTVHRRGRRARGARRAHRRAARRGRRRRAGAARGGRGARRRGAGRGRARDRAGALATHLSSCDGGARGSPAYTPEEQALAEVQREVRVEDLLRGRLDVVRRRGGTRRAARRCRRHEAGAVVAVARLADRADRDDVLVAAPEPEARRDHLVTSPRRVSANALQRWEWPMKFTSASAVEVRDELARLLEREDVLVRLRVDGVAVGEPDARRSGARTAARAATRGGRARCATAVQSSAWRAAS